MVSQLFSGWFLGHNSGPWASQKVIPLRNESSRRALVRSRGPSLPSGALAPQGRAGQNAKKNFKNRTYIYITYTFMFFCAFLDLARRALALHWRGGQHPKKPNNLSYSRGGPDP